MKTSQYGNQKLAKIFFEIGYILNMKGVAFKPRAFEMAAESVIALGDEVRDAWKKDGVKELKKLPGIGQSTGEMIDEYYRTGHVKEYDEMKKKFPVDIWELASIEGMGPKTIEDFYHKLKIKTLADLKKAIKGQKIRTLKGYGVGSEKKIARGLAMMQQSSGRRLLADVLPTADAMVEALKKISDVKQVTYAGSLRRKKETVGDIDLVATSDHPEKVVAAFIALPQVRSVIEQGKNQASVRLRIGIDSDILIVPDKVYGAAIQHFTGDKRHNVLLRSHALKKGYTLSEFGIFKRGRGKRAGGNIIPCKTEDVIYKKLGMQTPPPEIRIGEDEIEAALQHNIPKLLPYGSVKGDLQVQTNWTDGSDSIEDMARAAKKAGLSYMAVTDHTKALAFIHGLNDAQVLKQIKSVRKANASVKGIRILAGTECDIRKDGALDLKDATLKKLDWVGISVHSSFRQSRAAQTKRVVRAMSNRHVHCYFHPFAGKIGVREPIELDFDELLAAAKKYRVLLEIDASPERSDLHPTYIKRAVQAGIKLVIDSDAHAPEHFEFIPLGEALARRGWATTKDILNTKSVTKFLAYIKKKKP